MGSNDVRGGGNGDDTTTAAVVSRVADNTTTTGVCEGIPSKLGILLVGITVSSESTTDGSTSLGNGALLLLLGMLRTGTLSVRVGVICRLGIVGCTKTRDESSSRSV